MSERITKHEALQRIAAQMRDAGQEARVLPRGATQERQSARDDDTSRTVEVEWVGERSPLESPLVEYKLARQGMPDGFTPHQAAVIRAAAKLRIGRWKGHSREIGVRDGLSRTYLWGHRVKTFVRRMPYPDAERLKASASGHEFRIVGHEPDPSPLRLPEGHIRLVGDREFNRIETVAALERSPR